MNKLIFIVLILVFNLFFETNSIAQQNNFCEKKLIGYVTNWSDNSSVDYSNLTHAFFSFLKPSSDGGLMEFSTEQEMALSAYLKQTKKFGCKRVISLGGGGDEFFPVMANNPIARQTFISNVIEFCKQRRFDGIDMDWELMDDETKKKDYTSIMKEFKTALSKEGLLLVATIGYGNYWGQWIENEALQQADWIQLMIYDQTATWATSPFGNHASFEHFLEAEKYWTERGFTKDKIVMGLPFYGYKFSSKNGGMGTAYKYSEIMGMFPSLKSSDDQTPGDDLCFFNGKDMINKKTKYALDNGYAGVMVWEMSQDVAGPKSLHASIIEAFKNYCENK